MERTQYAFPVPPRDGRLPAKAPVSGVLGRGCHREGGIGRIATMPAPITFSEVECEEHKLSRLLEPVATLCNVAVAAWLYPAWKSVRVRWEPDASGLMSLFEEGGAPLICYCWHANELVLACAFREFPRRLRPTGIGHDGFLSRALHRCSTWYGFPIWVYRRRSPVSPRRQMIGLLSNGHHNLVLFPDAGGPDEQVKAGMVEVAQAAGARLVPLAMRARPAIGLAGPRRYHLPLPFAEVVAYHGEPLDGRVCTVDDCQRALEELDNRMRSDSSTDPG